jgi:7-carboxy-7-deazaguanine synthase
MTTDTLLIHEIYRSVQGETSFVGLPCTLVRLSRCNLRCRWCDTPQAFTGGTHMPRAEVVRQALALNTPLVLVTGGEPLLQAGTWPLLADLCDAGKTVMLETSGERDIAGIDPRVHRIVDMKAPGSGEHEKNRYANLDLLGPRDQLKVVVADRTDYEWARALIRDKQLEQRAGEVLLSPVHGELHPKDLVAWVLDDTLRVRVQLQMHKYIWGADAQGV